MLSINVDESTSLDQTTTGVVAMDDGFCPKIQSISRTLYKALKSLTGLIIILVIYNIIGAVIFVHLEAEHERQQAIATLIEQESKHEQLILVLTNMTSTLNDTEFEIFKDDIEDLIRHYEDDSYQDEPEKMWDFWTAMYFCGTIITTIGFGNIHPKTDMGKVVSIFYAAFGIPLAVRVLAEIGTKLTIVLKFFYFPVKRCCCNKRNSRYTVQDNHKDNVAVVELTDKDTDPVKVTEHETEAIKEEDTQLPVVLPILILIIYILLGGVMFTFWESWGYLDAFYFVFISVSTIGLGDIIPAHTKYFMVTSVYVYVGLALVSMCINVLVDVYIMSLKAAVNQVDKVTSQVKKGCCSRRQST